MPNWVYNRVTVEGESHHVKLLHDLKFDFEKLYPCPDPENWYNWQCAHWGTKWAAKDVEIVEYEEGDTNSVLEVIFDTAWSAPHGFLAHMTEVYPSLKIHCHYEEEAEQTIGEARYADGLMEIEQFHPPYYAPSALAEFSRRNSWFHWEHMKENLESCGVSLESMEEDNQKVVETDKLKMTFEEYVENSQKQFAAIDQAIKKGHVEVERGS